ncbi:hypothetical protein EMCRGX_G016808 [Ephydatia muelleri]|eukprot:Em0008g536a
MPPKKKKSGKTKKKVKKEDGAELSLEEQYLRTVQEMGSLKDRLAEHQELARRSRASEELMKEQVVEAKAIVEEEKLCKREVAFDLTRQYKSMKEQLESKVEYLEAQIFKLRAELDSTKSQLAQVIEEKERLQKERGEEVSALTSKLHLVEKSYEAILQEALDSLAAKIEMARTKWDAESQAIDHNTLQTLLAFGRPVSECSTPHPGT